MNLYSLKNRSIGLTAFWASLGAIALTACSTYNGITGVIAQHITPYRVTIVQGNFVSSEAASKLQVGMTREQVRATLGTPLLTDMFHAERWDYVFYLKRGSTSVVQERDLVVYFDGDHLTRWTGAEDLPSNQDLLAEIDGDKRETSVLKERSAAHADTAQARAADTAARAAAAASGVAPTAPVASSAAAVTAAAGSAAAAAAPAEANAKVAGQANAEFAARSAQAASAPAGNLPPRQAPRGSQSQSSVPPLSQPQPQFTLRARSMPLPSSVVPSNSAPPSMPAGGDAPLLSTSPGSPVTAAPAGQ